MNLSASHQRRNRLEILYLIRPMDYLWNDLEGGSNRFGTIFTFNPLLTRKTPYGILAAEQKGRSPRQPYLQQNKWLFYGMTYNGGGLAQTV